MENHHRIYNVLELTAGNCVYYDVYSEPDQNKIRQIYPTKEFQLAGLVAVEIASDEFTSLLEAKLSMSGKFFKPWFAEEFKAEKYISFSEFRNRVRKRLNSVSHK